MERENRAGCRGKKSAGGGEAMEVESAIVTRRSIRKYKDEVPDEDSVEKILNAGLWAPSGLNNQPWKFKVLRKKAEKNGLTAFTKYKKLIENAPVCVCIFLDKAASYHREKDIMAIGALVQNMMLQAHALGMGSCWIGEILNRKGHVEKYLNVPGDCELMAVLTLGYSDEEVKKGERKTLQSLILP